MRHSQDSGWLKFPTSIFTTMTEAANRANAVNLAQGFPSFDGPEILKTAAAKAMQDGHNQYAPAPGLLPLREALAKREQAAHGLKYDPASEVTVLSGATEALFCSIIATCQPGDEIICFAPFYDSYPAAAFAAQAKLIQVETHAPDWQFDVEDLRKKITKKTAAILMNTPQNPTGKVFSLKEMQQIADLAKQHDLWVITDEVYEHIVFDNNKVVRMASLPDMRERTVTISSFSKTFSMTGWKVGYCFAPQEITRAIRNIHQFVVFCSSTPLQWGALAGLTLGKDFEAELQAFYLERRNYLMSVLKDVGFTPYQPQGSYFIIADYRKIKDVPDLEFSMWLTDTHKVATVPASFFYIDQQAAAKQHRLVRFAFCKDMDILQQAAGNLRRL